MSLKHPSVSVRKPPFDVFSPVLVIGAGACGLSTALAARDAGAEVAVLEQDPTPLGSTAMSTGLIPAAGTPEQAAEGVEDSPEIFLRDIMTKTKGRTDETLAHRLAAESAETVAWLRNAHRVPLSLVDGFLYPGHSCRRMYGTPGRSGAELMGALERAARDAGVDILTEARVETLHRDQEALITGVTALRPDGRRDPIGCAGLMLATCGFGAHAGMVARFIPEMSEAVYHGHNGNKGDAIAWGEALGAQLAEMSGYQGHGGLAVDHGLPILWPLIMEGGFQVNCLGLRFSNEALGYSEQAAKVNAQPGRLAWSMFDERLHQLMLSFQDYLDAVGAGAVVQADSLAALAAATGLPADRLAMTFAAVEAFTRGTETDPFGRDFQRTRPLQAPYRAAKVTGALFHTQGGLAIQPDGRVLQTNGEPFANLFAGGGAARGISGPDASGYLAGNGLLTATTLGRLAGRELARLAANR